MCTKSIYHISCSVFSHGVCSSLTAVYSLHTVVRDRSGESFSSGHPSKSRTCASSELMALLGVSGLGELGGMILMGLTETFMGLTGRKSADPVAIVSCVSSILGVDRRGFSWAIFPLSPPGVPMMSAFSFSSAAASLSDATCGHGDHVGVKTRVNSSGVKSSPNASTPCFLCSDKSDMPSVL